MLARRRTAATTDGAVASSDADAATSRGDVPKPSRPVARPSLRVNAAASPTARQLRLAPPVMDLLLHDTARPASCHM